MLQGQLWHPGRRADSKRASLRLDAAPGGRLRGRGCEQGLAPQTGEQLTGVRVPQPRLHAAGPPRAPRAKRMNQPRPPFPVLSLKSAGGRAQRRSMLAFREHSPSRPSRPRGAVWLPRDSLRKGSELQYAVRTALPATSPRHRPKADGAAALKRSREARPRARVCAALLWCCLAPEQRKTRRGASAARRPPPGVPKGLRRGSTSPQRAGACDRAPAPRGPWGAQRSPGLSAPTQPARPRRPGRKVT